MAAEDLDKEDVLKRILGKVDSNLTMNNDILQMNKRPPEGQTENSKNRIPTAVAALPQQNLVIVGQQYLQITL